MLTRRHVNLRATTPVARMKETHNVGRRSLGQRSGRAKGRGKRRILVQEPLKILAQVIFPRGVLSLVRILPQLGAAGVE